MARGDGIHRTSARNAKLADADVSKNNVKSMLFRTRNRLREFLKKEGVEV